MKHAILLTLLGVALIVLGISGGGWMLLAVWLGGNFLLVGIAHALGAHRVFGKRPDGTLPVWSWIVFLPLHLYTSTVWRAMRLLSREPASNIVANDLVIGRRLLANEVDGELANYVDLTAEFQEPAAIRKSAAYICFPILDASAPAPSALEAAVNRLRPGRTFIHCAQGHGRTALFTLAVMLKSGAARNVAHGVEMLKKVRPGIDLNRLQRRCIEEFTSNIRAKCERDHKVRHRSE